MKQMEDIESPMIQQVSFNKLLQHYDAQLKSKDKSLAARAKHILDAQAPYPELREGFEDLSILEKRKDVIGTILADTFSPILAKNEIKAASIPFSNLTFNLSDRFKKILNDAGKGFELQIRNLPKNLNYILQCTTILNFHYKFNVDFKRPLYYDIPDDKGLMRHYRIMYNADFLEFVPTSKAKDLNAEDFNQLLDDFDNLALWKEKIPPNSFISKGFVICNIFDVTAEQSISDIKSSLIGSARQGNENFMLSFQDTFRSLFNLKDIKVGFTKFDYNANKFVKISGNGMESFILDGKDEIACEDMLCSSAFNILMKQGKRLSISNVEKSYKETSGQPYQNLFNQGIKSAIISPILDSDGTFLGVLGIMSRKVNELNSINANKLEDVMPHIVSAINRSIQEEQNLVDAIIQHECTTVHPSVYWKFQEEAKNFMKDELSDEQPTFNEICFKDVYPLFGQIDIKDSSKERNAAIQKDLMIQLSEIYTVIDAANKKYKLPIYEELIFRLNDYLGDIKDTLYANSEQSIFEFIQGEINPIFHHLKRENKAIKKLIETYESNIDNDTESYYDHRRNYDESVMEINKKLAAMLDKKQLEAQEMFPHYFERYKTDGIEHNMYIGDEIANDRNFDPLYLNNLRLWQLQVMVEMENKHYSLKSKLPLQLDVASLLLVYSTPLAIRFRMDEKHFDVDGTYNARYEIIKKRIDKSFVKGTNERLTQQGKLSIVYSQKKDEKEYLRYIKFLKSKGYFTNNIEILELEGLQGVTGLKAIRVEILYKKNKRSTKTFTYEDLMKDLNPN